MSTPHKIKLEAGQALWTATLRLEQAGKHELAKRCADIMAELATGTSGNDELTITSQDHPND